MGNCFAQPELGTDLLLKGAFQAVHLDLQRLHVGCQDGDFTPMVMYNTLHLDISPEDRIAPHNQGTVKSAITKPGYNEC